MNSRGSLSGLKFYMFPLISRCAIMDNTRDSFHIIVIEYECLTLKYGEKSSRSSLGICLQESDFTLIIFEENVDIIDNLYRYL